MSDELEKESSVAVDAAPKSGESVSDLLGDGVSEVKIRRAKNSRNITKGMCHILATFNNTKVCFSDMAGNVVSWSSSGKCSFRGQKVNRLCPIGCR
jgi:small subunit ribosomal protein S11